MNLINNYFSIKDSLLKLHDRNYDQNINNTIDMIVDNFNEDQIKILARQGLKLTNIIRLYYIDNAGFRCYNEQTHLYGKLPICNNIEKFMNKEYRTSVELFYS